MLEIEPGFSLVPMLVTLPSTDDCLFLRKELLCGAKNSEVLFCSTKRLVYLLPGINCYLILHFFPQEKRSNLHGVSGLLCGHRKFCGVTD